MTGCDAYTFGRCACGINAIGCVVNALMDWLLIFGNAGWPELGIVGAGWATVLGCTSSAAFGLWLFLRP